MKRIAAIAACALLLAGCASSPQSQALDACKERVARKLFAQPTDWGALDARQVNGQWVVSSWVQYDSSLGLPQRKTFTCTAVLEGDNMTATVTVS